MLPIQTLLFVALAFFLTWQSTAVAALSVSPSCIAAEADTGTDGTKPAGGEEEEEPDCD